MPASSDRPETRRIFIGFPLDIGVAKDLAGSVGGLWGAGAPQELRVYPARDFHMTLCFLGDLSAEACAALGDALAPSFANLRPPHLRVEGMGAFPNWNAPRVLWAGVRNGDGGEFPSALYGAARAAARTVGWALRAEEESRPFRAHVTLARIRQRRTGPRFCAPAGFRERECRLVWEPRAVHLLESCPGNPERRYRSLLSIELG